MSVHTHDKAEVLTPTEARQAKPGRPVFKVLVISLGLAVVAAVVLYSLFSF